MRKGEVKRGRAPEIKYDEIEFGELIGKGCFGSVWKGRCRGVEVAIKVNLICSSFENNKLSKKCVSNETLFFFFSTETTQTRS